MRTELDWSEYQDRGMGDAYADIPKQGGDFAKAVAVCIRSGVCLDDMVTSMLFIKLIIYTYLYNLKNKYILIMCP
jgi:hypothetical protein